MGLLRKLFAGGGTPPVKSRPTTLAGSSPQTLKVSVLEGGTVGLEVVGESYYQSNIDALAQRLGREIVAVLKHEPQNQYDPNAIAVMIGGIKVGHLSRDDAKRYLPGLKALEKAEGQPIALRGRIVGGGSDRPSFGVWLSHDPADFGLASVHHPNRPDSGSGTMRTGLSTAQTDDESDDSYDLSWMDRMPPDSVRAISWLRKQLETERDPIDRHFMMAELERLLYKSREAFPSALDEYDAICAQHDGEMDEIVRLFVAKWESVPMLETYRQMCIRLQKAKDFEGALRWAERGLALYGTSPSRSEFVADLSTRAEKYRSKLGLDASDGG